MSHKLPHNPIKGYKIYSENDLEDPKLKTAVFASNNIMEAVNQKCGSNPI